MKFFKLCSYYKNVIEDFTPENDFEIKFVKSIQKFMDRYNKSMDTISHRDEIKIEEFQTELDLLIYNQHEKEIQDSTPNSIRPQVYEIYKKITAKLSFLREIFHLQNVKDMEKTSMQVDDLASQMDKKVAVSTRSSYANVSNLSERFFSLNTNNSTSRSNTNRFQTRENPASKPIRKEFKDKETKRYSF